MYNTIMGFTEAVSRIALLSSFFGGCETCFDFLEREHGYTSLSGLASYERGRVIIHPYDHQHEPPRDFTAMVRFEKNDNAIELIFEEKNYTLSAFGVYRRLQRLPLADVLQTARNTGEDLAASSYLFYGEQMQEKLSDLAACFRREAALLLEPAHSVIEQVVSRRTQKMQKEIEEKCRWNMDFAARQAVGAFEEKDYCRVVALLKPYEAFLSGAILKKLEIARRKLTS